MRRNYNLSHKLIAFVLFVGLLLQSCGGFQNQVVPQGEKQPSRTITLSDHPLINTDQAILTSDQAILTSGGYLASFYQEDGRLKANLKADEKQPTPNYRRLPVLIEEGANLTLLTKLDPTTQKNRIKLNLSKSGQLNYVTICKGGISGGMKEGDDYQEKEKQEDLSNSRRILNVEEITAEDLKDLLEKFNKHSNIIEIFLAKREQYNKLVIEENREKVEFILLDSKFLLPDSNLVSISSRLVINKGQVVPLVSEDREKDEWSILATSPDLPNELWVNILFYIPGKEFKKVRKVNRRFYRILRDISNKHTKRLEEILSSIKCSHKGIENIDIECEDSKEKEEDQCREIDRLICLGANINFRIDGEPTWYFAKKHGFLKISKLLADRIVTNNRGSLTLRVGDLEINDPRNGKYYTNKSRFSKFVDSKLIDMGIVSISKKRELPSQRKIFRLLKRGKEVAFDYVPEYLYWSAEEGNIELAKRLITKLVGPDPVNLEQTKYISAQDDSGITALHRAVWEDHKEFVEYLLSLGADINIQDNQGRTPLHWAAEKGHLNLVGILIKHGANVNAKDKDGETPLHRAVPRDHREFAEYLLKSGAEVNINIQDNQGRTPLHWAAEKKSLRTR